jgi:sigma-B regulation protein RsbU (phosphoserine phosphatase)
MDFTRGRLGGGLTLDPRKESLEPILNQILAEIRSGHPGRVIDARIAISDLVLCDAGRIAQLACNLVSNAVTHGDPATPIRVVASSEVGQFALSVTNAGAQISDDSRQRLFQPFYRAPGQSMKQGLGLGLYIVSEIARAHSGEVSVESSAQETRFTFRMPAG